MRRRLSWLGEQVGWFFGIAASLLMLVILLPLVPLFKLYDDVRRAFIHAPRKWSSGPLWSHAILSLAADGNCVRLGW